MAIDEEQLAAAVVKALENPSVRAGLLEAIIKPAVDAAVKDAVSATCEEMARRLAEQQKKIDGLETEVRQLTAVVTEQAQALNDIDQYSRKGSIIVSGMLEQANESVEDKVVELGRCVGVDVAGHIDVAHRMGRLSSGRTRPIIIRFKTFGARQELFAARRRLRTPAFAAGQHITAAVAAKIFLSDSLTRTNQEILYKGRQMRKDGRLWAVWSDAGKLKAKVNSEDETRIIRSMDDLHRLVGGDARPPPGRASDPASAAARGVSEGAAAAGAPSDGDDGFIPVSANTRARREAGRRGDAHNK